MGVRVLIYSGVAKWKHTGNVTLAERDGFTAVEEDEGVPLRRAEG
jgi:hypothetical protein